MKDILNEVIAFLFIVFAFPGVNSAQTNSTNELTYEVYRIHPPISITSERLKEAHTLIDLNQKYPSSWVKEYNSVEVLANVEGRMQRATSKNDTLSQEQKDLLYKADVGTDLLVNIKYIPENKLIHNDPKEFDFAFVVDPDSEAKYVDGQQQLKQYVREEAIDKIPDGSFMNYDLAAIKFTISEHGEITDAHVFDPVNQAYEKEQINELLLETVRNMPNWKPAEYADGTKVKQEFMLTVGNMENCVVNLLNIRPN